MSKPDVYMPLFIGDYLAGTSRLTTEQHGAYLLLIMDYWMNGPPPDNDAVLASITRMPPDAWSNARAVLEHYFRICNGVWMHGRVEEELATATEKKRKSEEKAAKAAAARWGKPENDAPSNAPSIPQAMHKECPSPSPSPLVSYDTNKTLARSPAAQSPTHHESPTVAVLPTNRFNTIGETFRVTDAMLPDWEEAFPGVNIRQEISKARAWLQDNPTKRKTSRGMRKFLNSWFSRQQDRGGGNGKSTTRTRERSLRDDLSDTSWAKGSNTP